MTRIFFDMEFTGLQQNATPVSLGMITEDGRTFYAEFTDYDRSQVSPWIEKNVIANLLIPFEIGELPILKTADEWQIRGRRAEVSIFLREWLSQFDEVEIWGDCLPYDWVIFCELFEAEDPAERLPSNVFYIPFDICTFMKLRDVDPDISREALAGISNFRKHNALDDARIIRACFARLEEL
jgi:hypothetical protein